MDVERIKSAEEIFQIVADLPADQRESVLSSRCAGDATLRAFVDQLLRHHETGMGSFMRRQVFTPSPNVVVSVADSLPERIGGYEVLRVVGEGGMGVVYGARQQHPQRTVALKIIRSGLPSRCEV